jgi:hypothetical protein
MNPQLYRDKAKKMRAFYKPWRYLLFRAAAHAKKKGLPFDLDHEWAKENWTGKCALTGIEFKSGKGKKGPTPYSASIDKIDPAKGYTKENSRFILCGVNFLKGIGTDDDMYHIAHELIVNRPQ